ncbi:MAG TPA: type VI secretion system tube protein Hcp [Gemmataceae bacterium]|nr:type VI secretion system tube protein Hcp [Gemmataceae bacterium]
MFDCYLKIGSPDVKGESTDKSHTGEIQVEGFSLGASNPSTISSGTSGSSTGKVNMSTLTINKRTDKSSAILFQACCSGEHYGTAKLTVRKSGKTPLEYLIYTFTEVFVNSVQWNGTTGEKEDSPLEEVQFSFASVHVKYVPQKPDGSGDSPIEGGWDVQTNTTK